MGIKTIAGFLSLDPKTVRRYIKAGREHGLSPEESSAALTDDVVVAIMAAFRNVPGRPRGESWDLCRTHRAFIDGCLTWREQTDPRTPTFKRLTLAQQHGFYCR